jgi:hypothetical protein
VISEETPLCCDEMERSLQDGIVIIMYKSYLENGRIMNMVESEYYLKREREHRDYDYYGINFCPFCGMAISLVAQGFAG